eukprot:3795888-Ditylum_brightwellii.AAC.1
MAKITFNTLSQSSNKEELACDKQSGNENGLSEHNKSDKEQTMVEKEHDGEEDSSNDESSSSSSKDENPITQDKEFKKSMKPTMLINVMTTKQKLLVLWNTPPHDPGDSKQQE